ncbi:MAG: FadR/GntR family transcriptional regulator [Bacillota bacterium]|uniref:FCD domain-containing protein n=1 Tax=Thermanaerosceptrum fracticalcis TaxID=1712410 RepID=A0A7G6E0M0_THEFR|nr:FadR/GntR family transcriptional regulator [Thermanaerosceptrum fracticalcis]QNB45624.1 FCD domain-containing protein [Thermanaerosceptrum fracticalcis]
MFKPIPKDPVSIHEKIVKEIQSSILRGKLKPGDKLPSERTLAEHLGVSRTSLREALKILAASGVVTIKQGQGIFVAEQPQPDIYKVLSNRVFTEDYSLEDLYDLRKVLETQAVVWAVRRASEQQLQQLKQIIAETRQKISENPNNSIAILTEHDTNFHNALAEASGNKVLVRVMQNLLDLIEETRTRAFLIPGRGKKSLDDHQKIVDAISSRDSDEARQAMYYHLESVAEDIRKVNESTGFINMNKT